jgi:hypothetical protein
MTEQLRANLDRLFALLNKHCPSQFARPGAGGNGIILYCGDHTLEISDDGYQITIDVCRNTTTDEDWCTVYRHVGIQKFSTIHWPTIKAFLEQCWTAEPEPFPPDEDAPPEGD